MNSMHRLLSCHFSIMCFVGGLDLATKMHVCSASWRHPYQEMQHGYGIILKII